MDDLLFMRVAQIASSGEPRAARALAAADLIRREAGARWIGVYTVADGMVRNEAWSGPAAPAHPAFPVTQGLTSQAVRTCSLALSNDVAADPRYLANQDDSGSELIVPVLSGLVVVGTLDVESGAVGAFRAADILRYENLAAALRPLWVG